MKSLLNTDLTAFKFFFHVLPALFPIFILANTLDLIFLYQEKKKKEEKFNKTFETFS